MTAPIPASATALDHEIVFARWFLSANERGNPATTIDRRPDGCRAYTRGNSVHVLVDGATYFRRLHRVLTELDPGDRVSFTDWRGDADELLAGPQSAVGTLLARLARRGVEVRGLLWRSHADRLHFSERENRDFGELVNESGGEVLLDERVRRGGCHHQKLVIAASGAPGRDAVAFVGGIDLSHGRHDDDRHHGDPQVVQLDPEYGSRPAWHDVHLEVRGPAVADLEHTFLERWNDDTPLDHRSPWRAMLRQIARQPRRSKPLSPRIVQCATPGTHAVQVLRTYPAKRPPYPFAPEGERSVGRAYLKALRRARALVYIEDQYFWSDAAATALADALKRWPQLRVIVVLPHVPDRNGRFSGPPYRLDQIRALARIQRVGGPRVAVYDLLAETGAPIYVHAKVCVIDDVWFAIGSDNVNRRSWTNDSELSCAVIDETADGREPRDPAGLGDGARRLSREVRLQLWGEHLGCDRNELDELIDPIAGFNVLARAADALDAWVNDGSRGPRPAGRLRPHRPQPVRGLAGVWARFLASTVVDPDGRPRRLRRAHEL